MLPLEMSSLSSIFGTRKRDFGHSYTSTIRHADYITSGGALGQVEYLKKEYWSYMGTSRMMFNKEYRMNSRSPGWFSTGDGNTKMVKAIDLDNLSFFQFPQRLT